MKKKLTRKFARRRAVHDRKIKKNYTIRKCMLCENDFKSSWIGNRFCSPCKNTDYYKTGNDYSIMEQ